MAKKDTRVRILEAAKKLFSEKGFNGSSVRDIAELSECNLAAINYHFSSKQGLYWALLKQAHKWMENGIEDVCRRSANIQLLVENLFEFLIRDEAFLKSTMKSLLSDDFESNQDELDTSVIPGMPGSEALNKFIRLQLTELTHDAAINWVANSILSTCVHMALMSSTPKFKLKEKHFGICRKRFCIQHLKHLAQAAMLYASSHQETLSKEMDYLR